jgi:pimeloyl-ACP methyl ester carboxylesterase
MSEFDINNKPVSITLSELLGDINHIACVESKFQIRGLTLKTFSYSSAKYDGPEKSPIIALHGGPAFTHNYILPLMLMCDYGHTVIFYDQCGCGESTIVKDPVNDAPWLLTLDYYLEELRAVLALLHVTDYYLYGSSWGTIIGE